MTKITAFLALILRGRGRPEPVRCGPRLRLAPPNRPAASFSVRRLGPLSAGRPLAGGIPEKPSRRGHRRPGRRRGQGHRRRAGRRRRHRHGLARDQSGRARKGGRRPGRGQGRGRRHGQPEEPVPGRDPEEGPAERGPGRDLDAEVRDDLGGTPRPERQDADPRLHPLGRLRRRRDLGRLPRRAPGGPGRRRRLRRPGSGRGRPPRPAGHRLQQRQFRL